MTLSDDELRAHLERRAAATPPVDLADPARIVASTPRRDPARGRLRSIGIASAAASVVLAIVLVGSSVLRDASLASPSPAASSLAVGTPSQTAPPTPPPAEVWKGLLWREVAGAPFTFPGDTVVMDGIADGDGFLVVGYTINGNDVTGRIWRSADGQSWRLVEGDWLETAQFERVLRFQDGYVMLGRESGTDAGAGDSRQAVWWSVDGSTWVERTPEGSDFLNPWSAAAGRSGLLIYSSDKVGHKHWLRSDADFRWTRVDADWPDDVRIFGVAAGGAGWLAFGATGAGGPTTMRAEGTQGAIWTSSDAVSWVAATVNEPGGQIHAINEVGGRLVALGSNSSLRCDGCLGTIPPPEAVVTWVSADGQTWRRTGQLEPASTRLGETGANSPQVTSDSSRLLAFNLATTGQPMVRQSFDGAIWSELPVLDADGLGSGGLGIHVFPDVRTPLILGHRGVITFAEDPYDADATARGLLPQFGAAAKFLPDGLRPFASRPEIIPNDQPCPNQEPCGP